MTTQSGMHHRKPFTGRTMLFWLFGFFGVIFAANGVLVWLAESSFPGVTVDSSYKASQAYNQSIATAKEQAERGWEVDAGLSRTTETAAHLEVTALDRAKSPLAGLAFTATLQHPAHDGNISVMLDDQGSGRYSADLSDVPAGNWYLILEARSGEERVFRSENRLFLKD